MKIEIEVKHVYGVQLAYPACTGASLFCKIAGTKTLTPDILANIRQLGYTVELKMPDAGDLLGGVQ